MMTWEKWSNILSKNSLKSANNNTQPHPLLLFQLRLVVADLVRAKTIDWSSKSQAMIQRLWWLKHWAGIPRIYRKFSTTRIMPWSPINSRRTKCQNPNIIIRKYNRRSMSMLWSIEILHLLRPNEGEAYSNQGILHRLSITKIFIE